MGTRRDGRVLAFQSLYRYDMTGQGLAEILDRSWMDEKAEHAMSPESHGFAALLVQGTLERIVEVDACIRQQLENWDFERLARVDLAILRMSVYALLYQAAIPATVTIDEAVDIAREYGGDQSYRFVNGVLDGVRKAREHT
jgi:N utilization substance protein B